jgi:hydroxyacylglutathione hydrolase
LGQADTTIASESDNAMPLEIVVVPCLTDNYAYLLHDAATGETALVDAPAAAPIRSALNDRGWHLTDILITHHHGDHVHGVEELRHGARVIGAAADTHRLPPLDLAVHPGDSITVCGEVTQVIDVPGHTVGHVAFYMPGVSAVFTADSLMALGCGRLFEGTPEQMWQTLVRLAALPGETRVFSGHEYTASNARFAATIDPDNPDLAARAAAIADLRENGQPTVPATIALELATNPFMRANLPYMKQAMGMAYSPDAAVFAEIRARKDRF